MKIITFFTVLFFSFSIIKSNANDKLTKLGLIAELAYIKNTAEAATSIVLNKKNGDETQKQKIYVAYNELKTGVDQFVLQLASDMTLKNSRKYFKKLNHLLKDKVIDQIQNGDGDKDIAAYVENLKKIELAYNNLKNEIINVAVNKISVEDITGPVELINTIIGGLSERRASKVEKLVAILEKVRLASISSEQKKES